MNEGPENETEQEETMPSSSDAIPLKLVRRATTTVFAIFLVTMAVFLVAAYRSESKRYARGVFEHLEETSAVLSSLPQLLEPLPTGWLTGIEQQLGERTGVRHQVLVADSDSMITDATSKSVLGGDIRLLFQLEPFETSNLARASAQSEGSSWLASATPLGSTGRQLFLMRSNDRRSELVMRFWGLHGLHVGVTLVLFLVLLKLLGEHYIRKPIERLAGHVQRVEQGEFETRPETYEDDEFGWLARRFSLMGLRLQRTVRQLVRSEKYASAVAVAYRAARESASPLNDLNKHINRLDELAPDDSAVMRITRSLKKDYRRLIEVLVRLQTIEPADDDDEITEPAP